MTCSVTINDGTATVVMDTTLRAFRLGFAPVPGGAVILRFINGNAKPQTRWQKERLTLTGEDNAPSDLKSLDYTQASLSVTVKRGPDTFNYSCTSIGVQESWNYDQGTATWTLVLEEV